MYAYCHYFENKQPIYVIRVDTHKVYLYDLSREKKKKEIVVLQETNERMTQELEAARRKVEELKRELQLNKLNERKEIMEIAPLIEEASEAHVEEDELDRYIKKVVDSLTQYDGDHTSHTFNASASGSAPVLTADSLRSNEEIIRSIELTALGAASKDLLFTSALSYCERTKDVPRLPYGKWAFSHTNTSTSKPYFSEEFFFVFANRWSPHVPYEKIIQVELSVS